MAIEQSDTAWKELLRDFLDHYSIPGDDCDYMLSTAQKKLVVDLVDKLTQDEAFMRAVNRARPVRI